MGLLSGCPLTGPQVHRARYGVYGVYCVGGGECVDSGTSCSEPAGGERTHVTTECLGQVEYSAVPP